MVKNILHKIIILIDLFSDVSSVMKNKLENIFQCLVMSWKWVIKSLIDVFFLIYQKNMNQIWQIKKLKEGQIKKYPIL
jgi:hypothetical protein